MATLRMVNVRHILQRWRKNVGLSWSRAQRRRRSKRGLPSPMMETSVSRVFKPGDFGHRFEKGARVLELHFYATQTRGMFRSLSDAAQQLASWNAAGFSGVYGDTPTPFVIRFWEKLGATIIDCPPADVPAARTHFHEGVRRFGFPSKYENLPMKRIVLPFEK